MERKRADGERALSQLRLIRGSVVTIGALAGCFVLACRPEGTRDYTRGWYLEVANQADDEIRVAVSVSDLTLPSAPSITIVLGFGGVPGSWELGVPRTFVGGVHFFGPDSETPYTSYVYYAYACSDHVNVDCEGPGSEASMIYTRSDGATERLFVKSPERPFYLELNQDDGSVRKLVITFVPSARQDLRNGSE